MEALFRSLDEVAIQIRYGPMPDAPAAEYYEWEIATPQGTDEDELARELMDALLAGEWPPPPFDLQVSKEHFSWGAEGTGARIVLYVSEVALSAGTGALIGQIARELRARANGWEGTEPPLSRADAICRAQRRVLLAYPKVDANVLAHIGEEEIEDGWRIELRSPREEFTVELRPSGVTRIRRELRAGHED